MAPWQSLKKNWRELKSGTPGKRFQDRYRKKQEKGDRGNMRVVTLSAAVALIVVGIVFLVIPGPGSVLIVVGAALLAEESSVVARGLDRTELRIRKLIS